MREREREREPPVSTPELSGAGAVVTVSRHSGLCLKALWLSLMKLLVNLNLTQIRLWLNID